MSEELQLSRRGLLQMVGAVVATASFAARRPLFGPMADSDKPIDAEIVENDLVNADRASGAKLESFLKSRGIKPAHLARESGYSRQHLLRLRSGQMLPTQRCALQLTAACRRLSRERVRPRDLFDTWLPALGGEA